MSYLCTYVCMYRVCMYKCIYVFIMFCAYRHVSFYVFDKLCYLNGMIHSNTYVDHGTYTSFDSICIIHYCDLI